MLPLETFTSNIDVAEEANEVVHTLSTMGIESVMLTGDNEHSAAYVAKMVGITDVNASLLPEEKVAKVKELQEKYGPTAMIGDGVNDSPVFGAAHVSMAMGCGSDIAKSGADVILLNNKLSRTVTL